MSKITEFTTQDFIKKEEEYFDMLNRVKERVVEIAKDCGKVDENWIPKLIDVYSDDDYAWVDVTFAHRYRFEKDKSLSFEAEWLFSDEYKQLIPPKSAQEEMRKQKDEQEYQEYLRLKAKFEAPRRK